MSQEPEYRVFSFGGGVQSVAVLVLQVLGRLPVAFDEFIFANVGADSENPDTLDYFEEVVRPLAARSGIKLTEVSRVVRGRGRETLLQNIQRQQKSVVIPVRMDNGAPGHRNCTVDHKIRVVDRRIRRHGWAAWVEVGLGISVDEFQRVRGQEWHDREGKTRFGFWKRRAYPLIDLRMTRDDCLKVVAEFGLPEPPKSSCWFCPFRKHSEWVAMAVNRPDLFAQAVALERELWAKRQQMGRDRVFLHVSSMPLDEAILSASVTDEESCESGYCHT
jgi:hypothetical protein